jgi:hypothetical protein
MPTLSISGIWEGTYYYPNNDDDPVSFTAVISQNGAAIAGSASEPDVWGSGSVLYASIEGVIDCNSVSFFKTYDPLGTFAHSVRYEGTLNQDCTVISGSWNIDDYAGVFEMRREIFKSEMEQEESDAILVVSGSRLSPG